LARIRGNQPEDRDLFPVENFVALFGRTSTPSADAGNYPSPAALLATLEKLTSQVSKDVSTLLDEELDQPADASKPHPIVTTRLSSLLWCAHHEFLHAGQIGLLRRLLGAQPRW
jgi:uncharacterized damage-inducible protein DinB